MSRVRRWRKLGRIFEPARHGLPAGCVSHAQSPHALAIDGGVRVWFSTRSREPDTGKFVSHVGFADLDAGLREVRRVSDRPVLERGGLGCFDEHGVFPLSPLRVGGELWAYTTGWSRRVAVSVETAIGLVVSRDGGETFQRTGPGPVMAAALHEPCLVGDAYVERVEGRFHMWYIFGTGWRRYAAGGPPERVYKIAHAVSGDGLAWERDGLPIVPDRLGPDECQALPSVVRLDDRWHLFFCYRQPDDFRTNPARGYRIGHAWTDDLVRWTRDDGLALDGTPGDWDGDMQCYPCAFAHAGQVFLLYNGDAFGRDGFGLAVLE